MPPWISFEPSLRAAPAGVPTRRIVLTTGAAQHHARTFEVEDGIVVTESTEELAEREA